MQIKQGTVSVDANPLYGYSVEMSLNMTKTIDSNNIIQWRDFGKEYDNITGQCLYDVDLPNSQKLEQVLNSSTTDNVLFSVNYQNGYRPLGSLFIGNYTYPMTIIEWGIGKAIPLGEVKQYTLSYKGTPRDVYTSIPASAIIDNCPIIKGFDLGGCWVPYCRPTAIQQYNHTPTMLEGNAREQVKTKSDYGEVAKFSVVMSEEQTRLFLLMVNSHRGGEINIITPANYNLFGRRYIGLTAYRVKLASNNISLKYNGLHEVEVGFELQIVGV